MALFLPLVLVLVNLALASLLDVHATSRSLCAHICITAAQDETLFCSYDMPEGTGLQTCLECLQGTGYVGGENHDYLPNLLKAVCAGKPPSASLRQNPPFSSLRRRAASHSSLSKSAIAGIAIGATLALALTAALTYFLYRRRIRDRSESTSVRSWKGPRTTTSSLDFKCRTRVTPMASRADFRRLHIAEAGVGGCEKRRSGVQPGDALGSNPVLASTLEDTLPATSPVASDESSWNGQTLYSPGQSPPYTGSIKWASPGVPSLRTPAPTYSPHGGSPYTLPSATPSSMRSAATLPPPKTIYTPPKYGSLSPPSGYHSAESGYRPLYPPGGLWEGPTRTLRTQRGTWDLRSLEPERGGAMTPGAVREVRGGNNDGHTRTKIRGRGDQEA